MKARPDDSLRWCPLGRLSIQRFEDGRLREMAPGAFNSTEHVDLQRGITGERLLSTYCVKGRCALWRPSLFFKNEGACGLSASLESAAAAAAPLLIICAAVLIWLAKSFF